MENNHTCRKDIITDNYKLSCIKCCNKNNMIYTEDFTIEILNKLS